MTSNESMERFVKYLQRHSIDIQLDDAGGHRWTDNVTASGVSVLAKVRPRTRQHVILVVKAAASYRISLYPVSTGRNWGYGSASPVNENCVLVDMSRLTRIVNRREVSVDHPVVVIEPGVTQSQLHAFLSTHHPELTFNVTGSGKETSILGNALDGGVGYSGPRRDDLFGLEVVTGRGDLVQTGFRRLGEKSPLAHTHPYGLGPSLDGLFIQGSGAIVLSACFRLQPRLPVSLAVSFAPHSEAKLPQFIDCLARLKREGVLTSVTHIGNRARTRASLSAGVHHYLVDRCGMEDTEARAEMHSVLERITPTEWTGLAGITGHRRMVNAALSVIRQRMSGLGRVRVVSDSRLKGSFSLFHRLRGITYFRGLAAAVSALFPLHRLATGRPTDVAIDNLLWLFDQTDLPPSELDRSKCGLLYINPALPSGGEAALKVLQEMRQIAADHGHILYTTVNIETDTTLVAVINLLFNRENPAEVKRARKCAQSLLEYLRSCGLEVYRARADMMNDLVTQNRRHWQYIGKLNQVMDPHNIIAPGRYSAER